MTKLLIGLFVSFSILSFGQVEDLKSQFLNSPTNVTALTNGGGFYMAQQKNQRGIKGSYFLDSTWINGKLLANDGQFYKIDGRYRIYDDEMQILVKNKVLALDRTKIQGISLDEKVFMPLPWNNNGKIENCFFQLIESGEVNLVLKRTMSLVDSYYNPALNVGEKTSELKSEEKLYYWVKNKPAKAFKRNKKAVLAILKLHSREIEKFAKTNNLNFKNPSDLQKIFKQYNKISAPTERS